MTPSSSASRRARAKLWLPPVSSNGLNRTRPIRWNALRPLALERARPPGRAGRPRPTTCVDPAEVRLEQALEAPPVVAPGQRLEPPVELGGPAPGDGGDDEAGHGDDGEEHEDRPEVVLDERGHLAERPPFGGSESSRTPGCLDLPAHPAAGAILPPAAGPRRA